MDGAMNSSRVGFSGCDSDAIAFSGCDVTNTNTDSGAIHASGCDVTSTDSDSGAIDASGYDVMNTDSDSGAIDTSGCDVTSADTDSGAIDASRCDVTKKDSDASDVSSSSDVHLPCHNQSPAEGGYGWVVVFASFLNAFIIDGVGSCYGLIYPHVMEKYGASASAASFAGSLFNALLVMGSASVLLVKRFGYRKVTMSGGVLACLSFILSTRSPNVVCFVLSYGLFTGCACGLVFLPSFVIVNSYFHEKRGLANGIITSGSGAGLLVLAQLVNYLLEEFSLDGALLMLAGVLLNTCVFSCLYRPPHQIAGSFVQGTVEEKVTSLTPETGSMDSGLLVSPSLSRSRVTLASVGEGLDDPCGGYHGVDGDGTNAESICVDYRHSAGRTERRNDFCEGGITSRIVLDQRECGNNIDNSLALQCEPLLYSEHVDKYAPFKTSNVYDELSEQETALLAHLYSENDHKDCVPTVAAQSNSGRKEQVTRRSCNNLMKNKSQYWPSNSDNNSHQFWMSAHNIPTQATTFPTDALHSSAYDVTHRGSAHFHTSRIPRGFVSLAERFSLLRNPRYAKQSRSCHDHCQMKTGQDGPAEEGHHFHPSHSCHFQLNSHLSRSQNSGHPRHSHHYSRLPELDKGSNLYLTGSISTLKNLQASHIHHLTASRNTGLLSSPQSSLFPQTRGSKLHLSHELVSQFPYSGLNIPAVHPTSAKENIAAHNQPIGSKNSSLLQLANEDSQDHFLSFSSKQFEDTYLAYSVDRSNMSISERSFHLVQELEVGTLDLEKVSQDSLEVVTSGYSLRQLLRMPCFHLFCIGSCLIQIGYPIPSIFLADWAYHKGFSTDGTTIIMGVMGGLNIAGRLLSGLLANMGVRPLRLLYLSLFFGGLACILAPLYTTLWSLVLFAGMFGFLLGVFPPIQPLVIVEYFGLDSLASVFGLLTSIKGVSSMLGPPLAGLVYDASGQYPMSFVFGGVVFLLSAAVHLAMPLFRPR